MIYRDRESLPILTLTEDRDYATYEELISLLTERPSNAVYIERDGILCGLITSGNIARDRDENTRRVPFNKKFTSIHPGEYMRARQIFKDNANINMLPVVSEDGRLLSDYVRWDSSIGTDYTGLLCKDPYVLQVLKADIQNVVFVQPAVHRKGANKDEIFLRWRQELESEGVYPQVIQQWEIKDYLNAAQYFLFVDEEEKYGAEALNRHLYCNKMEGNIEFTTITDYLCRIRIKQFPLYLNESFLEELQKQGVFVLAFDFEENSHHFLAVLREKVRKRNEKYGVDAPHVQLFKELKESFLGELFCETYAQNLPLHLQMSFYNQSGVPYLSDMETEFLHIQNSERLTVNQPERYDRCIYLYGPCNIVGIYVSDQYTVASLLQNEINQAGFSCKVVNRGFPGAGNLVDVERLRLEHRLLSSSFKRGDIVVLDKYAFPVKNFPILNLTDALEKHDAPADWFLDTFFLTRHCNHKASQVYAQAIYEALAPVLQQSPRGRTPVKLDYDYIDAFYLSRYFSNFDYTNYGTVGSIVMNCNPFTLGHRYLIEEALKAVDFLIIFVVEEDESLFSFQERFAMVCQGTSDLEHILVVPSGPYILSKNTFPEYFRKIDDEDLKKNTEDDITLFAEKIAPKLGITYRFVGEEREDKVTNEYNNAMKRILPRYGIQVVEIPRKANSWSVISASRVRACLSMNRMNELDELVPASTKRVLFL